MNTKSKIFVINLDRSPDRLEAMSSQLEGLSIVFDRIRAIDGQSLSKEEIDKYYSVELNKKRFFVPLAKNEIACYMSHLKACKKIVDDNLDYAIVLEDDLIFADGFKYIHKIIESIKEPWEYIKLINSRNKKKVIEFNKISVEGLPEGISLEFFKYLDVEKEYIKDSLGIGDFSHLGLVRWDKVPILAAAYVIKREAAQKFIKAYPKCYRPIDVDLQYPWEHKIDIQGIAPNILKIDESKESTIGYRKRKRHYPLARLIHKFKWKISSITRKK